MKIRISVLLVAILTGCLLGWAGEPELWFVFVGVAIFGGYAAWKAWPRDPQPQGCDLAPKIPQINTAPYLLVPIGEGPNTWEALGWGSRLYPEDGMPFAVKIRTDRCGSLPTLLRRVASALEEAEECGHAKVAWPEGVQVRLDLYGPRRTWPQDRDDVTSEPISRIQSCAEEIPTAGCPDDRVPGPS